MPHDSQHVDREVSQQNCPRIKKNLEGLPFNLLHSNTQLNGLLANELDVNFDRSISLNLSFESPKHGIGKNHGN